ncbi:MAG: allantoate amidohydrolase [Pirellulales bacterium]
MKRSDFIAAADRVMSRCDSLARCSESPDHLTRRFLSSAMRAAHEQVALWMAETGLSPRVDNAGNLIGRRRAVGGKQAFLIGSHLDTVANAGRYDGTLGVLIGLAVAELTRGTKLPFHFEVVAFSEEEGFRFALPFLGSSALLGEFQESWLERIDSDGVTMREVICEFGLRPELIPAAAYAPGEVLAYMEPHLEQGPVLANSGAAVGAVTAIVGQSRLQLRFIGRAGHAGTTPMEDRHDALCCAARFVSASREIAVATDGLRATVGKMQVVPNVPNVIPAGVELALDVRHAGDAVRHEAVERLLAIGVDVAREYGCLLELDERSEHSAVAMDSELTQLLTSAMIECGQPPAALPSGAGHDAMIIARRIPAAMLFIRHPGAISHHPDEAVDRDDVATAIEVTCRFVANLATSSSLTANLSSPA